MRILADISFYKSAFSLRLVSLLLFCERALCEVGGGGGGGDIALYEPGSVKAEELSRKKG